MADALLIITGDVTDAFFVCFKNILLDAFFVCFKNILLVSVVEAYKPVSGEDGSLVSECNTQV